MSNTQQTENTPPETQTDTESTVTTSRWQRLRQWVGGHKKIIIPIVALIVIAAAAAGAYYYLQNSIVQRTDLDAVSRAQQNQPATKISALTGLEVPAAKANRPVTGVMIENSLEARPQSALIDAGVVFEAVTEGGITRFLALYQEQEPQRIGPVRSLRNHFLDWVMGFDAGVAHVGGSAQALDLVKQRNAKDLDQFQGGAYFHRSSNRFAPHNMYTSMSKLDAYNRAKGYTQSDFTPYERKEESPAQQPGTKTITINYSSAAFKVRYRYRQQSNVYARFMAQAPHKDNENGKQITAKNVVLIRMPTQYQGRYAVMDTIGSGKATVFRDGVAIEGKWRKQKPRAQLELLNSDGTPIELNPGNTWFAILPNQGNANY